MPPSDPPPVLTRRGLEPVAGGVPMRLPLTAHQRTSLRGRRRSACGSDLVLQLPRGAALAAGEWLAPEAGDLRVRVEAAPEALLAVRSSEPLALMRAAYHLGNRHVAVQLLPGELRLAEDPVLADLLLRQGLAVEALTAAFEPEAGAYASLHHHHGGAPA